MTATFAPVTTRRTTPAPRVRRHAVVTARRDDRVYRRRRAVVAAVLVVLGAAGGNVVHDLLAGPGGVPASASGAQPASPRVTVVARPGDSLWSIAQTHHGDVAFGTYLEALIDRNGGTGVQAGQAVVLP